MRKITKRSAAVITTAVVAVGGGAAAWAAWSSTGTGTASATAGSAKILRVDGVTVGGAALVPGAKASVTFTVHNDNSYPVMPSTLSLGEFAAVGCNAEETFQQVAGALPPTGYTTTAIPQNGSRTYTWANSLELTADPDDACQEKEYTFKISTSAASVAS